MNTQANERPFGADVFHIRRPLRAAGGSQFYRDKSDRGQGTYCGADSTAYDIQHRDKAQAFNGRTPCAGCVAARNAHAN